MNLTLLLPWFPIILAVGVGGRLLDRARGAGLGLLSALFWILLVQSTAAVPIWTDPIVILSLIVGGCAIVLIGAWSGSHAGGEESSAARRDDGQAVATGSESDRRAFESIHEMVGEFDDWLDVHGDEADPWPSFDEFLRTALFRSCGARHVRTYRVPSEGEELVPLRDVDPLSGAPQLRVREGIVGHVVTTGRSYLAQDAAQGDLVRKLAEQSKDPPIWCFIIRRGARRVGVVVCRQLDIDPLANRTFLRSIEAVTGQCWNLLAEAHRSRTAELYDPVSKLLTRQAFLTVGTGALEDSYRQGEPVAVVVVTLERLRELNDSGQWALADRLIYEVSCRLRDKLRADDRVGRFDGSRFLLLLRRVDSELASLIIEQLSIRLNELCNDESRWGVAVKVRCGLAGSGTERPDLTDLVSRAVDQCHRARDMDALVASDLPGGLRRHEAVPQPAATAG